MFHMNIVLFVCFWCLKILDAFKDSDQLTKSVHNASINDCK